MQNSRSFFQTINPRIRAACIAGLALLLSNMAQARDYQVEIALFETVPPANSVLPGSLYFPKITKAMGLADDRAAQAGFKLVDDGLTLVENVEKINNSRRYRLLKHFAWRQPGLDARNALAIRINIGDTMRMYLPDDIEDYELFIPAAVQVEPERQRAVTTTRVNGTLKLRLGRFLHLESQLVFTDIENGHSYRLSQSRKMRSRELHYIDNERFGLLVRILPIEEPEEESEPAPDVEDTEEPVNAQG